jgi:hypothetical protein
LVDEVRRVLHLPRQNVDVNVTEPTVFQQKADYHGRPLPSPKADPMNRATSIG